MSAPPINYADPNLYEHLSLIVDEFEKIALRSGTRQGILATAHSPLSAMDMLLVSSDAGLIMGKDISSDAVSLKADSKTNSAVSNTNSDEEPVGFSNDAEGNVPLPSFDTGTVGPISFDVDLNELLGYNEDSEGRLRLGDYLDCLGCDLRMKFNWQMQPIDLLEPLGNLLKDMNIALDKFGKFIDPNQMMGSLCELLNGLNFLCIPDLISILMSLKMLFKSYLTFQLGVKVDWTMLLGPLLKLILDGVVTLAQQIAGVIVAPLDCAMGAIFTIAKLQDELASTISMASAVGARVSDRTSGVIKDIKGKQDPIAGLDDNETSYGSRWKDITAVGDLNFKPDNVSVPALQIRNRSGGGSDGANEGVDLTVPVGFEFDSKTTLSQALDDPTFLGANPFFKVGMAVQEAKKYIMDLVRKVITSLRSLEGLVSGNLSVNLRNLGLLLFVKDMINIIVVIIQLYTKYTGPRDWCEFLQNNPEVLEPLFPGTTARSETERIVFLRGPEVVAEVKTCFNDRTDAQSSLLRSWVLDLKRDGSS